jgi:hypothetical protein
LGYKRQFVVPNGTWVVLGATDHGPGFPPSFSSIAFGQFTGSHLATLLTYSSNTRGRANTATWRDWDQCETERDGVAFQRVASVSIHRYCYRGKSVATGSTQKWAGVLGAVAANLERLATPSLGSQVLRTDLHIKDNGWGYVTLTRYDFTAPAPASERERWTAAYASIALRGFAKAIDADDLRPGDTVPGRGVSLPD